MGRKGVGLDGAAGMGRKGSGLDGAPGRGHRGPGARGQGQSVVSTRPEPAFDESFIMKPRARCAGDLAELQADDIEDQVFQLSYRQGLADDAGVPLAGVGIRGWARGGARGPGRGAQGVHRHACTLGRAYTCTHHTYMRAHTRAHTYVRTRKRAHTHTHTQTHRCVRLPLRLRVLSSFPCLLHRPSRPQPPPHALSIMHACTPASLQHAQLA